MKRVTGILLQMIIWSALFILPSKHMFGQDKKIINHNQHFWISTNNNYQLSNRWSLLTDFHIRRSDFIKNPSFYFLRAGAQYRIKANLKLAGGYAHLWLTTPESQWDQYTNENRIYQQMSFSQRYIGLNAFFRVRNEQRILSNIEDGRALEDPTFVNRFRMLISLGVPFSKDNRTQLILADEIHLNFGKEIVYNTFNQNRLTIGIKQKLSPQWSFDLGYMMVYQQQSTGLNYNLNHTFRLFFYGNFDFRKDKTQKLDYIRHAEE